MIVGLVNFYDEPPELLERAVRSAVAIGCDWIVALDGRYEHYTGRLDPRSPASNYDAIHETAAAAGARALVQGRDEPWRGEPAKRTALFRLAESLTVETDWLVVVDADTEIVGDRDELVGLLDAEVEADVGSASVIEPGGKIYDDPLRVVFRALRGLEVRGNHYTYLAPGDRLLWGWSPGLALEPAIDLTRTLTVVHHLGERPAARIRARDESYVQRDRDGLEAGACTRCGRPQVCLFLTGFRSKSATTISATFEASCARCVPWYARRNYLIAQRIGIDPGWACRPRNCVAEFRELVLAAAADTSPDALEASPPDPAGARNS